MLVEVDQQVKETTGKPVTLAIASVGSQILGAMIPTCSNICLGVGSFAHSVVAHFKSNDPTAYVATVEPTEAACLSASLNSGKIVPVETGNTIMNGMNCGTVSTIAWPFLRDGVDASVIISDIDAHQAVLYLADHGVKGGPCGAAPLVALRKLKSEGHLNIGPDSVVVLFCTEGAREYPVPQ
jgi:diaminopropionate ammonia-lyase